MFLRKINSKHHNIHFFIPKNVGSSGKSTQNDIIYTFLDKKMLVPQESLLKMTKYSLFGQKIVGSSGNSNKNDTIHTFLDKNVVSQESQLKIT